MEAIGKLTSGLAHDYNNSLGVIMGFTELLSTQDNDNPKFKESVEHIMKATERASSLTQKLMSLGRKRKETAETININDILRSEQPILAKTLTPQIKLCFNLEENLWSVYVDKGCAVDAILNMSINAMHAMPEGGELTFTTSNAQVNTIEAQVLTIQPGDYVKLATMDTGIGMTSEVSSHIFEPFYSTKGENGTGLGLSQVFNFITEFKGTIRVYSERGHGSCFSIYLPRYENKLPAHDTDHPGQMDKDQLIGNENILVVDDERALREMNASILSSYGYTVFSASCGKEALEILEHEKIDLILSDVIMPGMNGFELAHIAHHIYPHIKIQLCSGLNDFKGTTVTNKLLADNLLAKPFSTTQLLSKVHKLLKH